MLPVTEAEMAFNSAPVHSELYCEASQRSALLVQEPDLRTFLFRELAIQATKLVDGLWNWLNVLRVHAKPVATKMIGLHVLRPLSDALFPDSQMRDHLPAANGRPNLPVSTFAHGCANPDPARGVPSEINDLEEPFVEQTNSSLANVLAAIVMSEDEPMMLAFDVPSRQVARSDDLRSLQATTFAKAHGTSLAEVSWMWWRRDRHHMDHIQIRATIEGYVP